MPRSINDSHLIVSANPMSPFAESYRVLRTNIQFSSVDTQFQVLMVASAQAGEGKTTVISNLAAAYAQEGKRVLLIDMDLRKPSLHYFFSQTNHKGLTSLLTGQLTTQDVVIQTQVPNLSLITAGPTPPHPAEMLSSQKMSQLMEELRRDYDIILVDTPPILAVTDGLLASVLCDGVILVVQASVVKKALVLKAKERLEHVQARIVGTVLNQLNRDDNLNVGYYGM
ncbi:CpsD/CapB family tyrosine-protein kinase [Paenibacillus radicis (ex Gao et al. 2016)]|uniref:non-specific protein-tyrosine kinase n=1 Tax=Paenibacillus radicis (ex Gao et al. 2016) TaxID=1737354 RepID=A0A917HE53_9BACL|nr:CpsD/CapB family tyrosine-protein kinase [Paenibacillus radicis (ex Gao et al. 2016)]GGG76392.1 tyrosine protein kinase [Paenibacillus radicis (ex Gao et al. 2016)]